jgi:hypothetical protein
LPKSNPFGRLSATALDSLRALKKTHGITRDEYWDNEGGVLANDYFEVWYPPGRMTVSHGMRTFIEISPARERFEQFFGRTPQEPLIIHLIAYMEDYQEQTGREWWYYAELRSDTLIFQPVYVLDKRGLASIAIPHEYYQWALGRLTNFTASRWLEEGVASYLSGEGDILRAQIGEFPVETHPMTPARVDEVLIMEETKQDARIAYYHAYRMVENIVGDYGEDKLRALVLAMSDGLDLDEACRQTFKMSYDDLVERLAVFQEI